MTQRKLIILLFVIAISFYILEGIVFNPFILWTALPLYGSFWLFKEAQKNNSCPALYGTYGFMVVSIFASYLYHLAWFFD